MQIQVSKSSYIKYNTNNIIQIQPFYEVDTSLY